LTLNQWGQGLLGVLAFEDLLTGGLWEAAPDIALQGIVIPQNALFDFVFVYALNSWV
jgi:hypothetical protein